MKNSFVISIDIKPFDVKPNGTEIGAIRDRLGKRSAHRTLTIEQIAEYCRQGHTIQCALLRDKQCEDEGTILRFIKQQFVFVDIDNVNRNHLKLPDAIESIDEILDIAHNAGIEPCIIYHSFSSGSKDGNGEIVKKFHVLFAIAEPQTDPEIIKRILCNLQVLYPQADQACKDPARILFGTTADKELYVNSEAVNTLESLLKCANEQNSEINISKESPPIAESALSAPSANLSESINCRSDNVHIDYDPEVLLHMIDTNRICFDVYYAVTGSYKAAKGGEKAYFAWADNYNSSKKSHDEVLNENRHIWNGIKYDKYTIGTLVMYAKQYNPDKYNTYLQELKARPQTKQVDKWPPMKSFDKPVEFEDFPIDVFSPPLRNYLEAIAVNYSVNIEMCVLPLLSTLSLCLQGKAKVSHPGTEYVEPINLYCLTIAEPGERKTSTIAAFLAPVKEFEADYNKRNADAIKDYKLKHQIKANQLTKELNKKSPNEETVFVFSHQLDELEKHPMKPLCLLTQDITPEALVSSLSENNERTSIIGDKQLVCHVITSLMILT